MKKIQRVVVMLSASATLFTLGISVQTATAEQLSALPTLNQSNTSVFEAVQTRAEVTPTALEHSASPTLHKTPLDNDNPPAQEPGPKAKSPLDFESFGEDPIDYRMPEAANQFKNSNSQTWTIGRPTAGGQGAGVIPAGLEAFYKQQINWQPCEPFGFNTNSGWYRSPNHTKMLCAYVIAPLDYAKPDGPTIALALLKLPAEDQEHRIGTLFADPGGPGASGMRFVYNGIKRYSSEENLLSRMDLIGFDPRGVGNSLPQIRCESSAAFTAQREGSDGLSGTDLDKIQEFNTKECYKNTARGFTGLSAETVIPQVGTVNVARDLDMMRSVVGDEKLNYLGLSYGTSIGYTYAKMFSANIRSMVLDGDENPLTNNQELLNGPDFSSYLPSGKGESRYLAQLRGVEESFRKFITACLSNDPKVTRANIPCALADPEHPVAANTTPTEEQVNAAYAKYLRLVRAAWKTGYYHSSADEKRPVSFHDLTWGTRAALYGTRAWVVLNIGLSNLQDDRDASVMLDLVDGYYGRGADGGYSFSIPAFLTISCVDSDTNDKVSKGEVDQAYTIAPLMDPGTNEDGSTRGRQSTHDYCYYYKTHNQKIKGDVVYDAPNILVVSSSYDPATPFENGVILAKALQGTLLAVANSSHCAYGKVDCATYMIEEYLSDPTAFTEKVRNGFYNSSKDPMVTGQTGVETKDIYSKIINSNECQVISFMNTLKKPTHEESQPDTPKDPKKPNPQPEPSKEDSKSPEPGSLQPTTPDDQPTSGNNAADQATNPVKNITQTTADSSKLASTGTSIFFLFTMLMVILIAAGLARIVKKAEE